MRSDVANVAKAGPRIGDVAAHRRASRRTPRGPVLFPARISTSARLPAGRVGAACHCRGVHDTDEPAPAAADTTSGAAASSGTAADPGADPGSDSAPDSIDALVGSWLSVPEAAQRQGVPMGTVRNQLKDRHLVAVRLGPNNAISIPDVFVSADGPRPELRGTIIVLGDGGMRDEDIVRWLFTAQEGLPADGTPMGSLLAGHKTEIRRRAMETAF